MLSFGIWFVDNRVNGLFLYGIGSCSNRANGSNVSFTSGVLGWFEQWVEFSRVSVLERLGLWVGFISVTRFGHLPPIYLSLFIVFRIESCNSFRNLSICNRSSSFWREMCDWC